MTAHAAPLHGRGDAPAARSALRSVAMPTEHGGWGLTIEPGLLGLLVAPSAAGACLAVAAVVAFLARTPTKTVLVDLWRGRRLERTALAAKVAAVELALLAALAIGAVALASHSFWQPLIVAVPLLAVELWFDMRSRGRRMIPELAGAVGICSVASMVVLADGRDARLAVALWLVLVGRVATSIPFVRAQIARLRNRPVNRRGLLAADVVAVAGAAVAFAMAPEAALGSAAIVAFVAYQRYARTLPVPPPKVMGKRQMAMGIGLVAVTALGAAVL